VADAKSHESPTESTTLLSSPEITPLPSFAALPVEALPGSIASEPERLPAMVSAGVSGRPLESGWQTFPLSTVLAVVWLSGTLIYLASVLAKMLWWQLVIRRCEARTDGPLLETVGRLSKRLGLRCKVRLLVTSQPLGPAVLGIVRPTVLLPEVLASAQPVEKVEPIVAHELIHVRRRDAAVGSLQVLAQGLWWFHPLVWWASRALCRERERCCDAEVVGSLDCPRQQYAQGLVDVLRLQRQLVAASVLSGMNPFQITQIRLETVMNPEIRAHRRTPWGCWLVFLAGLLLLLPGIPVAGGNQPAATGSPTIGDAAPASAVQSPAAIQGSWRVESVEQTQGRLQSESGTMTLVIDEKTIVMRSGRQLIAEMPYTLDASRNPPLIRFGFGGQPVDCICRRNGDRLTICMPSANGPRPRKFQLGPEGGELLLVLRRADDKIRPIYVMDVDGKNLRPLASVPEYTLAGSPRWSPDGKQFAFDACRPGFEEGFSPYSHVFVANADGTGIRDLGDGAMPRWSGDGKRLALSRYGVNRGVWIMNADGSRAELLDEKGWGAAWSPTAPRVAYTVYEGFAPNIRVRDLDQPEGRTLLTRRYTQLHYNLCWSPDGQWIALRGTTRDNQRQFAAVHVEGEAKGFKLFWPGPLDGPSSSPAPEGSEFCGTVSWTGDGRRLLAGIFAPDGRSCKLYFLDVDGHRPPQVLPGQPPVWRVWGLDLSPDGRKILLNGSVPPPQPEWNSVKLIGNEMLANPSFDTGMTGWCVYCSSPTSVTSVRDTAVYDTVPAAMRVTCTAASSHSIQVFPSKGLSITAGEWYLLRFRAKSTQAFTVPAVTLHKETSPWNSYATPYFNQPAVTKDWATHHVLFQSTTTAADARLAFNLGRALPVGGSLYIDTLSLRHCQFPGGRPWPNAGAGRYSPGN
jgi:uncharacterized protein (TIGR03067 family)